MVKQKLNWLNERDLSLLAAQEATQFIDPESYGSAESRDNARDHVEIVADYIYDKFTWDYDMFVRYCHKFGYEPIREDEDE